MMDVFKNKSTTYLFFYNLIQTIGWAFIYFKIISHYTFTTDSSLYENVNLPLFIFQSAAVLEIFHAIFQLVRSSSSITIQQVASRLMLVYGIWMLSPEARLGLALPLTISAWSVTEIIRYSFYTLNLLKIVPHFLVWMRYTFFIALYPIGITGELLSIYAACSEFRRNDFGVITLPNFLNLTFNYPYILMFLMALYVPLFPSLYMHMFRQRKKVLGGQPNKKSK